MKEARDDLRKVAENMILQDNDISVDDKMEMLDEDLNEDIMSDDWGFVDNLKSEGSDIELDGDNDELNDDPGIDSWS